MLTSFSSVGLLLVLLVVLVEAQTEEPTPAPNDCDGMEVGDFYFTYVRSLEPNEVTIFPFEDIPGDMKLYLTDNAWTGAEFQSDEGTLEFTTPAEGIPQATDFGYGPNAKYGRDWVALEGAFSLNPRGEQVILYCLGATEIRPLAAISYIGEWQDEGLPFYGFNESALPTPLAGNLSITLEHCDTWEYSGVRSEQVDVLRRSMANIKNWKGEGGCVGNSGAAAYRVSWLALAGALGMGSLWIY